MKTAARMTGERQQQRTMWRLHGSAAQTWCLLNATPEGWNILTLAGHVISKMRWRGRDGERYL